MSKRYVALDGSIYEDLGVDLVLLLEGPLTATAVVSLLNELDDDRSSASRKGWELLQRAEKLELELKAYTSLKKVLDGRDNLWSILEDIAQAVEAKKRLNVVKE